MFSIYKKMETANTKTKIQSIKELFNNIRNAVSRDQIDQIRTNIFKKERVYDFLTKKDKITRKQSKVFDHIVTYFNELYDDLLKQSKYQYNPYGLDLLCNKDDYYKPTEVKSAFDGNYVLYASNGDKDSLL